MLAVKMNVSETRVSSLKSETVELVEDGTDHPAGVSALVSRLNGPSSSGDAGSQGSPDMDGCGAEEPRQDKNFPWLSSFSNQCRAAIGARSMKQLDDLLSIYIEHVTPHYRDCHKLPNKAAKLKRNINDTMIFFHMLYMDIREPLENAFYYDKMTELMAMYLDLEITASKRGKDTEKTVTNKLSTSLYTFLDYSEDHILDALLKTKLINKHSKKVCVPLLRKVLSELVVRRPLAELTYVRFLLSFKMWKNVVADVEERRAINKLAAQRLHPPPEYFQDHEVAKPNAEVLPKVPKTKKNCTSFYLGAKFNVKDACRAFFRLCKDTCRSNVYRRNMSSSDEIEKPFLITSCLASDRINEVEDNGSFSLMNDIWSTISNGDSCTSLLGESDLLSGDPVEDYPKKKKPESPDSRVDVSQKNRKKEIRKKKDNSVPDPKFVILKTDTLTDPISTPSPAKGVQDRCLGSVFMMEQVNKVGGRQNHVKADPCEAELPTSSRQHSVLESLVYAQPGSDNEAVASSTVSPDAGSVPTSRLDTNECDSSVEILQSRQGSADVSLPLELKPDLNIDGKVQKEDLLLFSEGDPVAEDGGGCFGSPFSDFNFRLNEDLFSCRNAFEGMDQSSMMYRRADVTGSLPFQGSPLLEEDEDEFGRVFRWSSVPDYHPSVQSTIINQSSGTSSNSELSSCYPGVDSKGVPEESEEPKLGHDVKQGKQASQGMLLHTVMWGGKPIQVTSETLARYRAYISYMKSRSLSHPLSQSLSEPNSVPPQTSMSSPQTSSSNSILEGSDNLKILADEAVRVREASVAEAKSKSDLAANLNLPLKKRKSLPSVNDLGGSKLNNRTPSYSSAPMLSIAQVQANKSVIVMNSQYSWQNNQTIQPSTSLLKTKSATVVRPVEDNNLSNKPVDMSSMKKRVHFECVESGSQGIKAIASGNVRYVICKQCKSTRCYCKSDSSVHEVAKSLPRCCEVEDCRGMCKSRKVSYPNHSLSMKAPQCSVCGSTACQGKCQINPATEVNAFKSKSSDRNLKVANGIQKTRPASGSKCSMCRLLTCEGQCKTSTSSNARMKAQTFTPQNVQVLKCIQCKSLDCNGKCMTSHSRCSTVGGRKSQRCALCGASPCIGSCRTSGSKCASCLSGNCEGSCRLTGRSTNNSLSTVNDFSILNSSAFNDKNPKCYLCKNVCCGRCKSVSGFKSCPYCTAACNGNNIDHSIRSILGAGSKSKAEIDMKVEVLQPKKGKTSTSGRRTRSSPAVKQSNTSGSNSMQTFSVEDIKRRKKSLSKPVPR